MELSPICLTAIQEAEQLSANRGTNNHPCAPPDLARLITMWFVCVAFRQLLQLLLFLSPFVRHSCDKATQFAVDFDEQIKADASKHGDNYAYIVERSIRQTFGACELTVGKNDDGMYDKTDVMYFQKELSSGGFVNTVNVGECGLFSDHVKLNARLVCRVFPAWPTLIYANPELGTFMIEPFFAYQATGQWPHEWLLHDLGGYPKAHGHNDGNEWSMPLEESGDMLIMALSYIRVTNDKSQSEQYYDLLDNEQRSTDDFQGPLANQTNLAIKGIIGLKSMSVISDLLGKADKADEYKKYGASDSWGTAYNIFADKLLNLQFIPQEIYDKQNAWYKGHLSDFGLQAPGYT
ncbi:hypothetical protein BKA62DRAFT_768431 [Auriculariales sp. MPI-PUGE-AT-0066]|nr:hypothetical protein BKA62DRAFT_768431 [Auriculariales sp. MPI-PUGE-AT-0066]